MNKLWLAAALLLSALASAEAPRDRFSAGGYFRIMTRPDFQGGDSKLGYSTLYGRLLNEGPYGALELRLDALQSAPGTKDPWAEVHGKLEGGSFATADSQGGSLTAFRASQLYVKAGNILLEDVTFQVGTLESYFGDLGLYDLRPAALFFDTVGLSGRYQKGPWDVLVGLGDSGYFVKGLSYNTLLTAGGSVRYRLGEKVEFGGGGQFSFEPRVPGNRFAAYETPGVRYEDFLRREVLLRFAEDRPGQEDLFPDPVPVSASSYRLVGYLGFNGLGPVRYSNLYVNFTKRHPERPYRETFNGQEETIHITALTDARYDLTVGNELQVGLLPSRLDAAWAVLAGQNRNFDNTLQAGEDNRSFFSTVLRLQLYLTPTVHLLTEGSATHERSLNGNLYREHVDSVFRSTGGRSDTRGLQFGDAPTRNTFQLKGGVVLNPTGPGIYARPSLRFLYGAQYSSQQAAFGSGFVESLDQFNDFLGPERHWHHVVAVEAEGWF